MKTINSFRSKLFALTLALMASVSTFAYDYHGDLLCYNILTDSTVAVIGQSEYKTMPRYEYLPENLVIPSEVTLQGKTYKVVSIDQWAFYACAMLKSVIIPHTVTFIGMSAFHYCENLADVYIPYSVTTVEGSAFAYTKWYDNLPDGEVYINNTLYRYKGTAPENTQIVVKDGTTRIAGFTFWNQSNIISIELPQTLTVIEHDAFEGCTQLSSILIPKNVTDIGASAFADCTGLTEVICLAPTPPTMGQYANPSANSEIFARVDVSNATLNVRSESVEAYKNADQWKEFGQILPIKPITIEDQFPTLWGLQRTVCNEYCGESEEDNSANVTYKHTFDYIRVTSEYKPYILCNGYSLREEDNKIFLYSQSLNKDIVLYDFTLEVGDSLPAYIKDFDGTMYSDDTLVVTDISSVTLLDGKEYKKWTFDNGMEYVEGIGMYGGHRNGNFFGLIQEVVVPCHTGTHLVCASRNGKLLYQMDEEEMERLGAECLCDAESPEDLFPTLWGLQRTTFYHYTECSDSYSSLTASNEIVTINDKPYLRFGKLFLREENNQVLIYSAAYDKDLVLYDWNLEVGDSISLLAMDYGVYPEYAVSVVDYRVIVDIDENGDLIMDTIPTDKVVVDKISTITLLDGKEYKTWHLATGWAGGITYVEGIGILSEGYGGGDYLGLIRPEELPTCYYGDLLVCVSKNNKLLYQMDPVKMNKLGTECLCDYDRGPRKDNAKDGQIGGRPTPTQWNQLEVVLRQMDNNHTILQAETFSYTLEDISQQVNNKTYFQLARQSTKDTATTKSVVGALHFGKDEDNRVYFLRDGVEYVLYDFTAEIGDTVEIFAGINNYPQETTYTHVVVDKDTTEDGACRMFLEVVFPDETTTAENVEKVWLAGLGSIDGIVHNAAKRTSNAHAAPSRSARSSETESSVMLCAWREDSCLYTTNHPEYDTFGCVYNQDPTSVESPTSSSSYQKVLRGGQLLIMHNGKTYTVMGIEMK